MKGYTDLEQSKKLAEILPLESADMYYHNRSNIPDNYPLPIEWKHNNPLLSQEIPCWSLAALLGVLPKIGAEEPMVIKLYYANEPKERYICEYGLLNITSEYDNPVDACVEMILKLHELKML